MQSRTSLAVPRGSISAISGNRGLAFVVASDGESFEPRDVVIGATDDQWCEVLEGLSEGEVIIRDGYQVLQPGDRIQGELLDADSIATALIGQHDARTDSVKLNSMGGSVHDQ
jgi:hypothetical protein